MPGPTPTASRTACWATLTAIAVLGLPALVFRYLPMTDLPQHLAVASILQHHRDPSFGFASYYTVDLTHTPYLLPYLLMLAFGMVMSLPAAMHGVAFLAIVAYPIGVVALLRASGKPCWLAVLALPLVYNRAVFWGFLNYSLSIGLALAAFAFYVDPRRSTARTVAQAALIAATVLSHVYGLAMLIGLVGLYAVAGGYRALRERVWSLAPLVLGVAVWAWSARATHGYGTGLDPGLRQRLRELPGSILGGYQDASESYLLMLLVAALFALGGFAIPVTRAKLRAASPVERVAWGFFAVNACCYFVLPQSTWAAKFIHFRHAFLALALLPVAARATVERARLLRLALPAIAAGATLICTWAHFALFDREARGFDEVVASVPMNPRLLAMVMDPNGGVMANHPYLHFAAYAQAARGGVISTTFPRVFWNLPVGWRADAGVPETPENFEWWPQRYDEGGFGHFYDYALLRVQSADPLTPSPEFPFEPIKLAPPWQLYRRVPAP